MGFLAWVGLCLAVAGVVEFGLFGMLSRTNPNIARRRRGLYLNAGINVCVGLVLVAIFH